jgi:hypothetical protein
MKLELFADIRNRSFVMGLYNKGPFTLPPLYWQDNFDLQIKVLEPDTDGGFRQQSFSVVDVTPLEINVAVGLAGDPKASTSTLTKDETNDLFTGTLNLNTTEMQTAINAATGDYVEMFFELEIEEGSSRTSIKQRVRVYKEPTALYNNLLTVLQDSDDNDVEGDGTNIKIWSNDTDWKTPLMITGGGETDIDPTDAKAITRQMVTLQDAGYYSPYNHRLVIQHPSGTVRETSAQVDFLVAFPSSKDPALAIYGEGSASDGSDDYFIVQMRGHETAVTMFCSVVWDATNSQWKLAQCATLGDTITQLEGLMATEVLASNVATVDFVGEPYRLMNLTGNTTINTISRPDTDNAKGRSVSINLVCDGTERNLTFESGWNWICDKPTSISANSKARLCLEAFGPDPEDVWASYKLATAEAGGGADSTSEYIGSGTLDDVTAAEQYSWGSQSAADYTLLYLGGSWYDGTNYNAGGPKVTINYSGGSFTLPAASAGTTNAAEGLAHGYFNNFTSTGSGNITADFADAGSYGDNVNQTRKPSMALVKGSPIIPAMTANSDASHVASASSEVGTGFEAYKAFNRDYTTPAGWAGTWANPSWLQIQLDTAETVNVYMLASDLPDSYPIDWTFQGSNDGTNWFDLDEQHGVYWDSPSAKVYEVPAGNRSSFLYYRWLFSDANGSANISISQAQLF